MNEYEQKLKARQFVNKMYELQKKRENRYPDISSSLLMTAWPGEIKSIVDTLLFDGFKCFTISEGRTDYQELLMACKNAGCKVMDIVYVNGTDCSTLSEKKFQQLPATLLMYRG